MDVSKVSDFIGKSDLISDSFQYIAKSIVGFAIIIEIFALFFISKFQNTSLSTIVEFTKTLSLPLVIICFFLALFTGTIHIILVDSLDHCITSLISFTQSKTNDFYSWVNKKNPKLYKSIFSKFEILNSILIKMLRAPFIVYFGIPILCGKEEPNNRLRDEIIRKFTKYFDTVNLTYKSIDELAEAFVSQENYSLKDHILKFNASLIKGGLACFYYLLFYLYIHQLFIFMPLCIFVLYFFTYSLRIHYEDKNLRIISKAYVLICIANKSSSTQSS